MMNPSLRPPSPRALLFDMDGTLTEPLLDFPRIKAEMGIGDRAILEALAELSEPERAAAERILLRHEEEAAARSTLNPGCHELLAYVQAQRIPTALITRNSRASVRMVMERHRLRFDKLVTREDGKFKPHPEPLLIACNCLSVMPAHAWMIGDGEHDIVAGAAAGVPTIWISHGRERSGTIPHWRVARDLWAVLALLQSCAAD
jgi:HAD superfamily hydrolase (TIGR01509 family)